MATTEKGLKRGDAVVVKDRLWMIVDRKGRGDQSDQRSWVFTTRSRAKTFILNCELEGYSIIRLNDVTGTVV